MVSWWVRSDEWASSVSSASFLCAYVHMAVCLLYFVHLWCFYLLRFMTLSLSCLSCSCSLLIIEHGTQMNDGPSLSNQGPGKKKKKPTLGSPSQDAEARFSLGGPASDKDGREICCWSRWKWWEDIIMTFCYWLYFIYSSCITSWLDLEHGTNEAGGGITLLGC